MNLQTEISTELWAAVRRSFESQAWSNAILDGIHYLSDVIRTKSGLQSDGTALAGQAFGGKAPKLRLNRLQTESEKNLQAGVEQLLRGLYQAIRNPRSHERVEDSQARAEALLLFVNHLLEVIGHARGAFSMDDCVGRVLEENFVPNKRYAELLIAEVPPRHRLQLLLAVYRRKTETDGQKLRNFFQTGIVLLESDEAAEFFTAVSDELRESSDEASLRCVLQILDPQQWGLVAEVARLRSENRVIRNLKDGRYNRTADRCDAGALATWSTSFWPHFTLRTDVQKVLLEMLASSSAQSQDYVLKYVFRHFDKLSDAPPPRLTSLLKERLKAGDARFEEALNSTRLWNDALWDKDLLSTLAAFQPAESVVPDDDIPF